MKQTCQLLQLKKEKSNNMELPKNKVGAVRKSPKNMVIYGPPKIGKTTMLSKLDGCLIIDLENGSDMIEALKVKSILGPLNSKCKILVWKGKYILIV